MLSSAAVLLEDGCRAFGVPAAQLGLLRDGERAVWTHACAPETPFHAGSIAKILTATLVLDAASRGELDLDAAARPWDDTPRTLMAQTSGRPNALPDGDE